MVVPDTRADPRFRDNPFCAADDGIRFTPACRCCWTAANSARWR